MKSNTYRHEHFRRAMTMSSGQCGGVQHQSLELLDGKQCFNQLGLDESTIFDCVLDKSIESCSQRMVRYAGKLSRRNTSRC
jgi:hypothetical protein